MLERFLSLVEAAPEAVALIEAATGVRTTRRELLAQAEVLAGKLTAAGFAAGDLVALQIPNSVAFVAAVIAALRLRLVIVPIDRDATESEVAAILAQFSVRGLVYRPDRQRSELAITSRPVPRPRALPAEARLLKLTSGSTGKPKAIATSEENLIADCTNICATMLIAPDDVNFGAIPFSHSYGFSNLVTPLLLQGTAVVISNDYLPQSILSYANQFACTVVPGIPMMFDHLASLPVEDGAFITARTFISAGAPLPATTSRRFRERFSYDVHSFLGCSECGGITYDRCGGAVERGTVGTPMDNVAIAFEAGRLAISSASVALGYLHDEQTFQPFESRRYVADDLGELNDDREIVLTGRASDLINTAGKKVNPREVEQAILQIPGVRQVKVYGEPAGARGEVVAAAIVASPDVTREQVREFCRARLSTHKVPRIVKLIESIPVDERGKVKRAALAAL